MADIDLGALKTQKEREFGTRGAGLTRFDEDFIDAANRAIRRINRDADLDTEISEISTSEGTMDLDSAYEDVVSDGISFYMMLMGRRPAKNAEPLIKSTEDRFIAGIWGIASDLRNELSVSDTDDDTYDIIGLGKLGG